MKILFIALFTVLVFTRRQKIRDRRTPSDEESGDSDTMLFVNQNERILPPANCDYLGRGYDIYKGNPLSKSIDEGFRHAIFTQAFDDSNLPSGFGYLLPAGFYANEGIACEMSYSSDTVETMSDYMQSMRASVSVDASLDSPFAGGSFQFSTDYESTSSGTSSNSKKFTYSSAKCEVYRAEVQRFNPPELDTGFAAAIETLPDVYNGDSQETYFTFIKQFGNNVVTKVRMGSKLTIKSEFTASAWERMQSSNIDISLAASASASYGVASGSVGIGASAGVTNEQRESFENERESKTVYSIGARPPESGDAQEWVGEAELNPIPIWYELVPLEEYYVFRNGQKEFLLPNEKRENFKLAQLDYMNALNDKVLSDGDLTVYSECDGRIFSNSYCYLDVNLEKTWFAAQQYCNDWHGHLAVVNSDEKQDFLYLNMGDNFHWIGLRGSTWVDGTKLDVHQFSEDMSSDQLEGMCTKAGEEASENANWKLSDCDNAIASICERMYIPPTTSIEPEPLLKCNYGDFQIGNTCYRFGEGGVSWHSGKAICESIGYELAIFETEEEIEAFKDVVENENEEKNEYVWGSFWIGLTDAVDEGRLRWLNGRDVDAHNFELVQNYGWMSYSTRDVDTGAGDCVVWNHYDFWRVSPCFNNYGYLCSAKLAV